VRMWLVMGAGAVVLVACGVFFAFQDLGHADQYASVASFFLALLTAIASAVALARSKRKEQSADSTESQRSGRRGALNVAIGNTNVQQGDGNSAEVIVVRPSRKASRRNR
jgi:membrane protein implicated in regulation of membrane protease activity